MLWPWNEIYDSLSRGDSNSGDSSDSTYSPTVPAIEGTAKYGIALGDVAPGRDELVLTDAHDELLYLDGSVLDFFIDDSSVIGLLPRPGCDTFAECSGAKIYPQSAGQAVVTYTIDGVPSDDSFLVVVPPQSLIQILLGEASLQISEEAEIDDDYHVILKSRSPTAEAVAWVTRNRVDTTGETSNYSLFAIDETTWLSDPVASYYDAVITAESYDIYQYSPVDPDDPTHQTYEDANARDFLEDAYHRAYDQAVLSASQVFAGIHADPTGEAFAFYSPTEAQWAVIEESYTFGDTTVPTGTGVDDSFFPAYSPIQILVLENVWTYSDGRPAFVFIRAKAPLDYAVIKE